MDIKKLSMEILRDLYGSSRRLAMYPLGHQVTQDSLRKPLENLNKIFSFKHSFSIEFFKDMIFGEGICLDDTIYVSGLALDMKKHKLTSITLYSRFNMEDLYHILLLLTSKPGSFENDIDGALKSKNIEFITVNQKDVPRLFDFEYPGPGGDSRQFSLENRTKSLILNNGGIIPAYYMGRLKDDDDISEWISVDFRLSYISQFFRESLLELDLERGKKLLEETIFSTNWLDDDVQADALSGLRKLFRDFLSKHKDDQILSDIYQLFKKVGAPESVLNQIFNKSSVLKLRTFQESEIIVNTLKYSDPSQVDPSSLKKTIFKLAAAGQTSYLSDLQDQLIRSLSSPTNELRQKGLHLVSTAADVLAKGGFREDFNYLCREAVRLALIPTETLEPVELAAELIWLSLKESLWQEMKFLSNTLRGIRDDLTHPESKRALASEKLTEIAESSFLSDIFTSILEKGWSDENRALFEAFSNLGAKGIVRMLTDRITDPDINMRSRAIKLLISMRKDSAEMLSQILSEHVEKHGGGPLDDDEWYFFRNILRVLKEIHAEESLPHIEVMTNWSDSRLKLEIIKTLEGMPAENAGKLLEKLASDENHEVRKAAVVAMGLMGHPDMIPRLMNIFLAQPDCRINAVAAIGRIGGPQARDRLIDIFEDDSYFTEYDISKRDSEQIKVAILKALSRIGDHTAIEKIEEYSRRDFDKSLFRKDLLSNTAKIILGSKGRKGQNDSIAS